MRMDESANDCRRNQAREALAAQLRRQFGAPLLTLSQAGAALQLADRRIRQLVRSGRLPAYHVDTSGGTYRLDPRAVVNVLVDGPGR